MQNLKTTVNEAFSEIEAAVGLMGYTPLNECVAMIDAAKAKIVKACCDGQDLADAKTKAMRAQNLTADFLNQFHQDERPLILVEACDLMADVWATIARRGDAPSLKPLAKSESGGPAK